MGCSWGQRQRDFPLFVGPPRPLATIARGWYAAMEKGYRAIAAAVSFIVAKIT